MLTVLNKIDRLDDPNKARASLGDFPNALAVSALRDLGIEHLLDMVNERLFDTLDEISVYLPYQQGSLIALFHEQGQVARTENKHGGVEIQGKLPGRLVARYRSRKKPAHLSGKIMLLSEPVSGFQNRKD
jgi:GTP-binding protein HflX